jgi:hypothetical protein
MPRNRSIRKAGSVEDDLAFPLPVSEQAKYLELANQFLEPGQRWDGSGNEIPIGEDRRFQNRRRLHKKA